MLDVIFFLAGIHMTIVVLAACYRFLDLWYCIEKVWIPVLGRLLFVLSIETGLLLILDEGLRSAFIWGQACYIALHLSKYFIVRLLLRLLTSH